MTTIVSLLRPRQLLAALAVGALTIACGRSRDQASASPPSSAASSSAAAPASSPAPAADTASQVTNPADTSTVGFYKVTLVEKDGRTFNPLPPRPNGPAGTFWYRYATTPDGAPQFQWRVLATGLDPRRAYRLEMHVDDSFYSVASLQSDASGVLRGHGALDRFADRTCVGPRQAPPQMIDGATFIGVAIKNDGAPRTGAERGLFPVGVDGKSLPCSGNADGSFDYRLFEATPLKTR